MSTVIVMASLGAGLQASQSSGFVAALVLCIPRLAALAQNGLLRRYGWESAAVVLLAVCLRGSAFAMLSQHLALPVWVAALFAAPLGVLVLWVGFDCLSISRPTPQRWRACAMALVVYSFALRALFAGSIELLPEETYYWSYSRHLDISYLDHPPMVAWLIRIGTTLFGQSEFGVRSAALLCGAVTAYFAYRSARELFGAGAALAALLLTQTLPFFFLSGFLMTPDAPLTAAWTACLFFMQRALLQAQARAWWPMGVALGFGLISKYTMLLTGAVSALFMVLDPAARQWWRRYQPYAAALVALLLFLPVLIWNWQHDWASFAFQTTHRLADRTHFSLHRLIISALVVITPTGLAAVTIALSARGGGAASKTIKPRELRFFRCAVLLPMAVFGIFSLRHEVKIDWTGAPWSGALSLLALGVMPKPGPAPAQSAMQTMGGEDAVARRQPAIWASTLVSALLLLAGCFYYLTLGLPGVPYSTHTEWLPVGWRTLAGQVLDIRDAATRGGAAPVVVGMDRYAIASEMAFYGEQFTHAPLLTSSAHLFEGVGLMYALWTPAASFDAQNLLLVAQNSSDLSGNYLTSHTAALGPIQSFAVRHDGRSVRQVYYRLAYGYQHIATP